MGVWRQVGVMTVWLGGPSTWLEHIGPRDEVSDSSLEMSEEDSSGRPF